MSRNWLRFFWRGRSDKAARQAEAFSVMQTVQCDPVQTALRDQCH
ncbi:hypothetical protein FHT02_003380 [Sphingomonas xinjiangensis]|uniref:Uncharacterized protein n=1 Tax=Sphingomonas xinjiangensis TaxID=643568 RepID=A0A840YRQ1_9SPHN|nr:hypothetical protein [Sphingomonas xinjiangensis]